MASSVTIKLQGFKELGDALRAIGPNVAKSGLREADFAGAKIIRDAAKQTVPVKTGLLQTQIYASRRKTVENVATYSIIVKKKAKVALIAKSKRTRKYHTIAGPNVYGRFIEFGTSKMAARPFLRPAILNNVDNVVGAIKAGLQSALSKATRK